MACVFDVAGYHFERLGAGSVTITTPPDNGIQAQSIDIDSSLWCSLIASMTPQGETADTWRTAVDFHEGGRVFPPEQTYSA